MMEGTSELFITIFGRHIDDGRCISIVIYTPPSLIFFISLYFVLI